MATRRMTSINVTVKLRHHDCYVASLRNQKLLQAFLLNKEMQY